MGSALRLFWGMTCCAVVLPSAGDAEACSPLQSPVLFVGDSLPTDGATGVPVNAGILLRGVDAGRSGAGGGFALHSLALRVHGGEEVVGQLVSAAGETLAWAPATELLPNTTYDVLVRAGAEGDPQYVDDLGLSEEHSFSFVTGTEFLPPLGLAGRLTVDIEVSEGHHPSLGCVNMCGSVDPSCPSDGKVAIATASVHVPPVTGGNELAGYRGVLDYTVDAPSGRGPFEPRPPGGGLLDIKYFDVEVGEAAELQLPLTAGRPCLQVVLWDIAGRSVTDSVCVPEVDVAQLLEERNAEIAARGESPPSALAAGDVALAEAEAVESSGCSVAPGSGTRNFTPRAFTRHGALGWFGLVALLWFVRGRARD